MTILKEILQNSKLPAYTKSYLLKDTSDKSATHRSNLAIFFIAHYHEWMREYLTDILNQPWKGNSRVGVAAEEIFFVLFMIYAFAQHGGYLFIDSANLVVHEGGHLLFGWSGNHMLTIWGGTILQWAVPLMLAIYFFIQRQLYGFAFCLFFFFENWLYTATYMADARAMALPLVTTGDSDFVEHDWNSIFTWMGMLQYDTSIAAVVRFFGWMGMLGTSAWVAEVGLQSPWVAEERERIPLK